MALHLVPLAIGAAVGSLATYLYKDETARENIISTANKFTDKVKSYVQPEQAADSAEKEDIEEANPIS